MSLTQKQRDMIREAAMGGPRNWQVETKRNDIPSFLNDSSATTASPVEAQAAEEQAKASAGGGSGQNIGAAQPCRPGRGAARRGNAMQGADYTLSKSDWLLVDKALTEFAAKLERAGERGNANEVRELCSKFFDCFEVVLRDVQS